MKCVCCGTEVLRVMGSPNGAPPEQDAWDGAVVDRIAAGFGSRYDTSTFLVALCDPCIAKKIEDGVLQQTRWNHARPPA